MLKLTADNCLISCRFCGFQTSTVYIVYSTGECEHYLPQLWTIRTCNTDFAKTVFLKYWTMRTLHEHTLPAVLDCAEEYTFRT